jgi:hypothetical protein
MRLTKVQVTYTVTANQDSDKFTEFQANDTFYIDPNSELLKSVEGRKELREILVSASTRGGGREVSDYSNIEMKVWETINVSKHPNDIAKEHRKHPVEPSNHYLAGLDDPKAETCGAAIQRYENYQKIENADTVDAVLTVDRDLKHKEATTRSLKARYANDKIINAQKAVLARAERKLTRNDLKTGKMTVKELKRDPARKAIIRELARETKKMDKLHAMRDGYTETMKDIQKQQKTLIDSKRAVVKSTVSQKVGETVELKPDADIDKALKELAPVANKTTLTKADTERLKKAVTLAVKRESVPEKYRPDAPKVKP